MPAELAACQQELWQYQEYMPDPMHKPTPVARAILAWYTITLKARSEMHVSKTDFGGGFGHYFRINSLFLMGRDRLY